MEEKFRFTTRKGESRRIVEADPEKLCQANRNAALDKRVGGNSVDESSICRSTYVQLKAAVEAYKAKLLDACIKSNAAASCAAGEGADPQAAFRCVSGTARAAAEAERAAGEALGKAALLADKLREAAVKARRSYERDREAINSAFRDADFEITQAELAGNAARAAELKLLKREAAAVKDGRLVRRALLIDEAALTPSNGGESTITGYRAQLELRPEGEAPLVQEQDWAREAATAFRKTADEEIRARNASATRLSQYAAENERRAGGSSPGGSKLVAGPGQGLGSTLTGLTGLASAAAPLAGLMRQQQVAAPEAASQVMPAEMPASSPTFTPAASSSLEGSASGVPGGGARGFVPAMPIFGGNAGSEAEDRGRVSGGARKGDTPSATSYPTEAAGLASAVQSEAGAVPGSLEGEGKASLGAAGAAAGKDQPPAKERDGGSPCAGPDCTALTSLHTRQFAPGGSLGVPQLGIADPAFSPLGALEALFGQPPSSEPDEPAPTGVSAVPPLGWDSRAPAQAGVQAGARVGIEAESLFLRIRRAHEQALRRGSLRLYQAEL